MNKVSDLKCIQPSYVTLKHKDDNTYLRIKGTYEIVGFFPSEKGVNMCIVLKEKEDNKQ